MTIKQIEGALSAKDTRFALVVSRFNDFIGLSIVFAVMADRRIISQLFAVLVLLNSL